MIGGISGQQAVCRWTVRFFAKTPAGKNEFERVDGSTSLGVIRLRERFAGTADVVIRRKKAKQMTKQGENIEGL